jgi:hypothetical protein
MDYTHPGHNARNPRLLQSVGRCKFNEKSMLLLHRRFNPKVLRAQMKKIGWRKSPSLLLVAALTSCISSYSFGSSAHAEGTSSPYSNGGPIGAPGIVAKYNKTGEAFRIEGYCRSSCTMLLAIKNVCVDANATLAFHAAIFNEKETPSAEKNNQMLSFYNGRLRNFLVANRYLDSWTFHNISGSEIIHKFGYRQCSN